MKYLIMTGPFKDLVIETEATTTELNSVPDIKIEFINGPLKGLITRSLICYDQKVIEAHSVNNYVIPNGQYQYKEVIVHYG